ncbi:hypothetical protein OAA27_01070 [bacterium]|nr:hypothetical protein [bacterium]
MTFCCRKIGMMRSTLFLCLCFSGFVCAVLPADDGWVRRRGQYIELVTDLESSQEADRLVASFDAAVTQWVEFWQIDQFDLSSFRVSAFVMRDEGAFRQAGFIPPEVPDFNFGYAMGKKIWIKAQQSEYYTRHLALHEGVHAFMFAAFNGAGATWFQEGTAECLALHRNFGRSIGINVMPLTREEVPYWGRFKRMEQLRNESQVPTLKSVLGYKPNLLGDVGAYSWSWALVAMLDAYPEYRGDLLELGAKGFKRGPGFNRHFMMAFQSEWPILLARWQMMCHDLDYGFEWERERIEIGMNDPLWRGQPLKVQVSADQGWQSAGVRVPGGVKMRLRPSGTVTLANTTRPWVSEPAGITLRYHRGRPMGQLLVCVLPNAPNDAEVYLSEPAVYPLTKEATLEIDSYSWLLFRVNESVGSLSDNQSAFEVNMEVSR